MKSAMIGGVSGWSTRSSRRAAVAFGGAFDGWRAGGEAVRK
jgi:hypothetical protein